MTCHITRVLAQILDPKYSILLPHDDGHAIIREMERRRPLESGIRVIDDNLAGGLENGQIVEVRGRNGSGKTELIFLAILKIVAPQDVGGYESCCIYVDCENKFSSS
ncbi:MAG: hypothetical protein EZS28_031894 [Streblomastix strix]|uniref:Rad51-like C-terminal domain-containing protein n=1 Tax=Streblomastix strix TaxID=222440 RepID=A0A5J4UQA3_9EUKA|nr:MAG: hypothetical protein EZS28_031894 [Streblomastix strix]